MGRVGCHDMGGDELSGGGGGCLGGVSSGESATMFDDRGRLVWRRGWYVDRVKGGTSALGLGSTNAVRVLSDIGACALFRTLGSIAGASGVTLALLLAVDLF